MNIYLPMEDAAGLYIGAGAGYLTAFYKSADEKNTIKIPAAEATAGFYFGRKNHYFKIRVI